MNYLLRWIKWWFRSGWHLEDVVVEFGYWPALNVNHKYLQLWRNDRTGEVRWVVL